MIASPPVLAKLIAACTFGSIEPGAKCPSLTGSACTSGSLDPSHVLLAIGRPHEVAHGSLRLTLDASATEAEVDAIIAAVRDVVQYLRNMSPVWRELMNGERKFVID